VIADVDLESALDKRLTEHADALADRRPELYQDLTGTAGYTAVGSTTVERS
jgi:hypothetical protein